MSHNTHFKIECHMSHNSRQPSESAVESPKQYKSNLTCFNSIFTIFRFPIPLIHTHNY